MSYRFSINKTASGLLLHLHETRLLRATQLVHWENWGRFVKSKALMRDLKALVDEERAVVQEDGLFLPHATVAELGETVAGAITLPPLSGVSLDLRFEGTLKSDQGLLRLSWRNRAYQDVRPKRQGAILDIGGQPGRLAGTMFRLAEAADAFNATLTQPLEARIAAWAPVQSLLAKTTGRDISVDGFARTLTFYQAGAFTLDIVETANGPDFKPILLERVANPPCDDGTNSAETDGSADAPGGDVVHPLLPPDAQTQFLTRFFGSSGPTSDAYVLGRNAYLVIAPDLKVALDVVRQKRRAPSDERRAFLRNPRPAINAALEEDGRANAALFIETEAYSKRVEGLGLWQDIKLPPTSRTGSWLPEIFEGPDGSRVLEIEPDAIDNVKAAIEAAETAGRETIELNGVEVPLADAKAALQVAVAKAAELTDAKIDEPGTPREEHTREGLVTKENIDKVEFKVPLVPRSNLIPAQFPRELMKANRPKDHQIQGFDWLVSTWRAGWPGVLLADDMGLGKTYQALAFLAWIKANLDQRGRQYPTIPRLGPLLVVAPTALLRNWLKEAETHLAEAALGQAVEAFGSGLRRLKRRKGPDWTPEDALDVAHLREADWILTTYETLADNHRAFARIPYSVVVFDEMQKIKEPGSINTRSAKTLNADFVLGLTGTPVENRLEDLWSIFDRLAPGHLGALTEFSRLYGTEDPEALRRLKASIDQPSGKVPAPMLRRMKDQTRDGLPNKIIQRYDVIMPKAQADAYHAIVAQAQGARGSRASMLEILHRLRGTSLHPDRDGQWDAMDRAHVEAWIAGSARLSKATALLRDIAARGDKAIVFVEDLAVQRAFAEAIARLFDLDHRPARIDGSVTGDRRQAIVDAFQGRPKGFDLLILSPRAAGIGLTITAATHVIHLSRWWNPAVEDQCNDRAYRIGQMRDVTIHLPLAIHPVFADQSFDRKLDQLLESKRALSRDMLAPPESGNDVTALFDSITDGS